MTSTVQQPDTGTAIRSAPPDRAVPHRPRPAPTRAAAHVVTELAARVLGGPLGLSLRSWDGTARTVDGAATLLVQNPRAVRRMLYAPGQLGLARAYVSGDLDFDGDVHEALQRPEVLQDRRGGVLDVPGLPGSLCLCCAWACWALRLPRRPRRPGSAGRCTRPGRARIWRLYLAGSAQAAVAARPSRATANGGRAGRSTSATPRPDGGSAWRVAREPRRPARPSGRRPTVPQREEQHAAGTPRTARVAAPRRTRGAGPGHALADGVRR